MSHISRTRYMALRNAQMRRFTPPAVILRYCTVRLLLVLFDGTCSGKSAVALKCRYRKMAWFMDCLKKRTPLPWWYSNSARRMGKLSLAMANSLDDIFVTNFIIKRNFPQKQRDLLCAPNRYIRYSTHKSLQCFISKNNWVHIFCAEWAY